MSRQGRKPPPEQSSPLYWGADVPMPAIRRFARRVAELFQPDRIVLFGSHAYGQPHADSDVDILVVMPTRNQHDEAARIRGAVDAPFPMDLIVRTPAGLAWRLAEGESFHTEIVTKGKVLYEKGDSSVGPQAESDYAAAVQLGRGDQPFHDERCFHCQQSAEKFLKGLLEELGLVVPKTHDLVALHKLLLAHHPGLRAVRRGLDFLTDFAVDTRYPGENATRRQAVAAERWAAAVRQTCRQILRLRGPARRRKP
jgi:HEPN domain-containing protein/predicted nucleotidyltransferase